MAKQNSLFPEVEAREQNRPEPIIQIPEKDRDLFEMMTIEDLPNEDMRMAADFLGLEAAFLLIRELGGLQITIPKKGLSKLVEKYVKKHFDGTNAKHLAVKCNVSLSFVYNVINKGDTK